MANIPAAAEEEEGEVHMRLDVADVADVADAVDAVGTVNVCLAAVHYIV